MGSTVASYLVSHLSKRNKDLPKALILQAPFLTLDDVDVDGKTIGVTQVLNKRGGSFSEEDEARL